MQEDFSRSNRGCTSDGASRVMSGPLQLSRLFGLPDQAAWTMNGLVPDSPPRTAGIQPGGDAGVGQRERLT